MSEQADNRESPEPRFAGPGAAPPPLRGCEPASARPAASREAWRSDELLGDRAEVLILHNNEVYRLRRTRQGKLILHK